MSLRSLRVLQLLTPISAVGSLVSQGIALFTNEWLYSEELMPNTEYRKFNMSPELEYLSKFTISGLWKIAMKCF
ncbi:hypothetical protein B4U80_07742 [Leptotrombidium deliense]|uniref:Uncharacterized protein n=1 Tax=Leptotrombidium deliense TaxID=299467 RepID=A0A443SS48_9ACAR|nr:hypothetical protein B4U80_07742 [Leptotrombidium deliense]